MAFERRPQDDAKGKVRYHYPDFIIWYHGKKFLVEAKGEHLMDHEDVQRKAEAATKKWGSRYLLVGNCEIAWFEKREWFN